MYKIKKVSKSPEKFNLRNNLYHKIAKLKAGSARACVILQKIHRNISEKK